MILLDTDHFSVLRYSEHPRCASLVARLNGSADPRVATSIITFEEQMRGWLAEVRRHHEVNEQVLVYDRLADSIRVFMRWEIVRFDRPAANSFIRLRKQRVRIASQDLKIASIAIAHDALLLSANFRDFRRVPGLRVESWLE